jgi:lysophospholipase L1-like esterase
MPIDWLRIFKTSLPIKVLGDTVAFTKDENGYGGTYVSQDDGTLLPMDFGLPEQISILKTPNKMTNITDRMKNGDTVIIVCIGDSVTYGDLGTGRATTPYPLRLQATLRSYYNNNNITVINKGVNGRKSGVGLSNFQTDVVEENADLVIIMFGINDASGTSSITPIEDFKTNISDMIDIAIDNQIQVLILPTTPTSNTAFGENNKKIYNYGRAAIEVAQKYNVNYLDITHKLYEIYNNKDYSVYDLQNYDYAHFTQTGYHLLGDLIFQYGLNIFKNILTVKTNERSSIPAVNSSLMKTDLTSTGTNTAQFHYRNYTGFKNGSAGSYLNFEFFVDVKGVDLYLLSPKSTYGGKLDVYDNGVLARTIDFYSKDDVLYDAKSLILSNMTQGYHKIELNISNLTQGQSLQSGYVMYLSAFEFEPSIFVDNTKRYSTNSNLTPYETMKKLIDGTIKYTGLSGSYNQLVITDTHTVESLSGKTLIIEAEGRFFDKSGILFFANKAGNSNTVGFNFGYVLVLGTTSISLFAPSGLNGAVISIATGTVTLNYSNDHIIRIEVQYDGTIVIKVDGTTYITASNTAINSGYVGLYSQALSSPLTATVRRLEYCYI